jgi:hypothetical protein
MMLPKGANDFEELLEIEELTIIIINENQNVGKKII